MTDVAVYGEILCDMVEVGRRGGLAVARDFQRQLGGAQANMAVGLARLGLRVAIAGAVGKDRLGQALRADLAAEGIDVRSVRSVDRRTGVAFVLGGSGGEPEFVGYRKATADQVAIEARPPRAPWVVVGTSMVMTEELERATGRFLAAARGAHVFVDLNVRAHLWRGWSDPRTMGRALARLVRAATVLKASDADLHALGARGSSLRWLERAAPQATWLVTRGRGVASAVGEHGVVEAPAPRARCVDASGAGDAFAAGALATIVSARAAPGSGAWSSPELWGLALRAGHAMGRKAISRRGAVAGVVGLGAVRSLVARARTLA
jgi:fructokinase